MHFRRASKVFHLRSIIDERYLQVPQDGSHFHPRCLRHRAPGQCSAGICRYATGPASPSSCELQTIIDGGMPAQPGVAREVGIGFWKSEALCAYAKIYRRPAQCVRIESHTIPDVFPLHWSQVAHASSMRCVLRARPPAPPDFLYIHNAIMCSPVAIQCSPTSPLTHMLTVEGFCAGDPGDSC